MSTLLEDPATQVASESVAAQRLRITMAAMRLSFTWFGTRKTLSPEQKAQAAGTFGAEGDFLSAGKKLIDTKHPKFKAVTAVRGRAVAYFKGISLPFPEPGVRLIRQDDLDAVNEQMASLQQELAVAVDELDEHYHELKRAARQRLGSLYCESDYPATLRGLFEMGWDFPSVEPPDYLRQLSPELYRQECQRAQARFDEAVRLAEAAFTEELARLVDHLAERLTGQADGRPKVFRDSAVSNLAEFFERFRYLNIRSSEQLDALVQQAQQVLGGVQPQQLRDSDVLRQRVAAQLTGIQGSLDALMVERPRRNIIRRR